jgi:hypothetical protein
MGASNKWIDSQSSKLTKFQLNGYDMKGTGKPEYEDHPFQPGPVVNEEPRNEHDTSRTSCARLTTMPIKDLRQFDSTRRNMAH